MLAMATPTTAMAIVTLGMVMILMGMIMMGTVMVLMGILAEDLSMVGNRAVATKETWPGLQQDHHPGDHLHDQVTWLDRGVLVGLP